MAQRMRRVDNGQDGRSGTPVSSHRSTTCMLDCLQAQAALEKEIRDLIMGVLAVQVEKDPKTGTTTVKTVTPMSSSADVSKATAVFDDGRKSIHTVSGLEDQPSTEELDQILSVVSGVGLNVLLNEVTASKAEVKTENVQSSTNPEENVWSFIPCDAMPKKQLDSSGSDKSEGGIKREKCAVSVRNTHDKTMTVVGDAAETEDETVCERLGEDPVTLLFLGYTDATADRENHEGMLTAERVVITEDGEEFTLTPETSESLRSPLSQGEEKKADDRSEDAPLGGDEAEVQVQEEVKEKGKHTRCQCCSVM